MLLLLLNAFSRVRLCAAYSKFHIAKLSGFPAEKVWRYTFSHTKCVCVCVCVCVLVASDSLLPRGLSWNSPGKNTGVGCHCLLQGISPTQGSNPNLLHCKQILYHLNHKGSPGTSHTLETPNWKVWPYPCKYTRWGIFGTHLSPRFIGRIWWERDSEMLRSRNIQTLTKLLL